MSASVFPARAGMSPIENNPFTDRESVPRASGDEPRMCMSAPLTLACSPRERG